MLRYNCFQGTTCPARSSGQAKSSFLVGELPQVDKQEARLSQHGRSLVGGGFVPRAAMEHLKMCL